MFVPIPEDRVVVVGRSVAPGLWRAQLRLACHGGQRRCYFWETGTDIGGHGASSAAVVLMAGVGLCDGETEVALDPGQDCVPYPVRADLLGCYPREMTAEALPEIVVAAGGDWLAVEVPQEALA